jgi:uncharacterized lipoprotein YmbA
MRITAVIFACVPEVRGWSATSPARFPQGRVGLLAPPRTPDGERTPDDEASGPALPAFRLARGALTLLMLACSFLAVGCSILPAPKADAARFYTLGEKASTAAPAPSAPVAGALRLGLARVELPAYLQNRAMAVRAGSEIRYEQNHRWAEPLDEAVARVVRASLLVSPKVAAVFPAPFPIESPRDYDVTVRVLRCEGMGGGNPSAQFAAVVEITRADATRAVVLRRTVNVPSATWDGKDFVALAIALGQAATALGDDIAAALPAN